MLKLNLEIQMKMELKINQNPSIHKGICLKIY